MGDGSVILGYAGSWFLTSVCCSPLVVCFIWQVSLVVCFIWQVLGQLLHPRSCVNMCTFSEETSVSKDSAF